MTHTQRHIYIYIDIPLCMYIYIEMHVYIYIHLYIYTYTYVCTHMQIFLMYVYVCNAMPCHVPGRSWTLCLDGFFNVVPSNDSSSEPVLIWSEETAARTVSYSSLSSLLRKELFEFSGTAAGSSMFQSASGYDVWFMLNVWEIAKLRRYYLHGGRDEAATLSENIWGSCNRGLKPVPDAAEPSPVCAENFESEAGYTAALGHGLKEIQCDFASC